MSALTIDAPVVTVQHRLIAFIADNGVNAADSPEALAGRVLAALGSEHVTRFLDTGSLYLVGAAHAYADPRPQTDDEWADEDNRDGHGLVDGLVTA